MNKRGKILVRLCVVLVFINSFISVLAQENGLDFQLSYYVDSTKNLNVSQILNELHLTKINGTTLEIGFTSDVIWTVIDIQKSKEDLILSIENAHLDSIEIFIYEDASLKKNLLSGDLLPFNSRYLNSNFPNFLIKNGVNKIVLKTKTEGMPSLPFRLLTHDKFHDFYNAYNRIHWIYFGFVILTIITNILFYIWLKERIYIYYAFCVFGIGAITALDFEYTFQFLWPNAPGINKFNISYYSVFVFSILFADKLLGLRKNLPKIYPVFLFYYFLSFVVILLGLFGFYNIGVRTVLYTSPFIPILCLSSGILILLKKPDHVVKFYLVGWSGYFLFMFLYLISLFGLIPISTLSANFLVIGSCFEIIFLNFAILSKINSLKQEKEQLLSEQNRILEEKVNERTIQLHEKNVEIMAQNEEMESQHAELEAQRDKLEMQNKIIEQQNILLRDSKESLEKIVEKRTEELSDSNKELVEYNNRLEQFAFVTAHNLRGPVATLLGLAQLYNYKNISDPVNYTVFERSHETTKKLDGIIKDLAGILDLQRTAALQKTEVNLYITLNDTLVLLSRELEESKAEIQHNIEAGTTFYTVPAFISNIFYNLLSNAIKYRRDDLSSKINIYIRKDEHDLRLIFSDNGRGIDLEKYGEKLFNPYKRFHLDKEGKGLGLYIVKTQVGMLKGTIELSSKLNEGCTFTIVLPLQ